MHRVLGTEEVVYHRLAARSVGTCILVVLCVELADDRWPERALPRHHWLVGCGTGPLGPEDVGVVIVGVLVAKWGVEGSSRLVAAAPVAF